MSIASSERTRPAFIPDGAWDLEVHSCWWYLQSEHLRADRRLLHTELLKKKVFPPVLRTAQVAAIVGPPLLWWFLKRKTGRFKSSSESRQALALVARRCAERLGPTFIKLAQIIASGEGVFPPELTTELAHCRDNVRPAPWKPVKRQLTRELGTSCLDNMFSSFAETPRAAASIAQVHNATLADGTDVVVKVRRPGISKVVAKDIRVLAWVAPRLVGRIPVAALANPPALVDLFAETILDELDFRIEASNMVDVAQSISTLKQEHFVVPRPHPHLIAESILVMERAEGLKVDERDLLLDVGLEPSSVLRTLLYNFMEGALMNGVFHGDLHSGNMFLQPDGSIVLLDFGIVGRYSHTQRVAFLKMLISATTSDTVSQVESLRDLGALPPDTDIAAVIEDLGLNADPPDPSAMSPEELIAELQRIIKSLLAYGAKIPKELMLYMKNMVFLDSAVASLAPSLDVLAEIEALTSKLTTKHAQQIFSDIGMMVAEKDLSLGGFKSSLGVSADTTSLSYQDLLERRAIIQRRSKALV